MGQPALPVQFIGGAAVDLSLNYVDLSMPT